MRTSINDRMTPSCDLNVKLPKNPQKTKYSTRYLSIIVSRIAESKPGKFCNTRQLFVGPVTEYCIEKQVSHRNLKAKSLLFPWRSKDLWRTCQMVLFSSEMYTVCSQNCQKPNRKFFSVDVSRQPAVRIFSEQLV